MKSGMNSNGDYLAGFVRRSKILRLKPAASPVGIQRVIARDIQTRKMIHETQGGIVLEVALADRLRTSDYHDGEDWTRWDCQGLGLGSRILSYVHLR